jgi:hypothetical protein
MALAGPCERRTRVKKCLTVAAAVLGMALSSQATEARMPLRLGGNVTLGFPVGEFRDNADQIGSGLSAYGTMGVLDLPFHVGASVGYMTQGSETIGEIRILPYVGDIVTKNNILMGHLFLRAQNTGTDFQPFVDALIGFERLYTTTEIRVGFNVPDIDMDRDDWAVSYGVGAGFAIKVYEGTTRKAEGARDYGICVELGARYLIGGRADYVDIDSVELINERIWFKSNSSRTDMVTVHIGASVAF